MSGEPRTVVIGEKAVLLMEDSFDGWTFKVVGSGEVWSPGRWPSPEEAAIAAATELREREVSR